MGLKLRLGQIAQPQVLGGSLIHFAITTTVFTLGLAMFMRLDWNTALLLAIALSFSSTVFSAKILESKRDIGAFYGRTAIGILIVQDIIALVVLGIWGGQTPTIWALGVFAIPLLRPALHWLLDFHSLGKCRWVPRHQIQSTRRIHFAQRFERQHRSRATSASSNSRLSLLNFPVSG